MKAKTKVIGANNEEDISACSDCLNRNNCREEGHIPWIPVVKMLSSGEEKRDMVIGI